MEVPSTIGPYVLPFFHPRQVAPALCGVQAHEQQGSMWLGWFRHQRQEVHKCR